MLHAKGENKDMKSPNKIHADYHAGGINAFPTELPLVISQYSLGSQARTPVPNYAPYGLTAVCRRWRAIASDIPELWMELHALWDVEAEGTQLEGRLTPSTEDHQLSLAGLILSGFSRTLLLSSG